MQSSQNQVKPARFLLDKPIRANSPVVCTGKRFVQTADDADSPAINTTGDRELNWVCLQSSRRDRLQQKNK